jgi:hypothetical protein
MGYCNEDSTSKYYTTNKINEYEKTNFDWPNFIRLDYDNDITNY